MNILNNQSKKQRKRIKRKNNEAIYAIKHADSSQNIVLDHIRSPLKKMTSIWKIVACFIICNLVIINLLNYWQPINHNNVKEIYDLQQRAIISAYDLHQYFSEFKEKPDEKAYNMMQKTVELNSRLDSIRKLDATFSAPTIKTLNKNIEKIIANIPSIKLFREGLDADFRLIASVKYQIISQLDSLEKNTSDNILAVKSLYLTANKIEELLNGLRNNNWTSNQFVSDFQANVEVLGLDLEQYNSEIFQQEPYGKILTSIERVFADINSFMPTIYKLSVITYELQDAERNQATLLKEIQGHEINFIDNLDDRTIIIATIGLSTLLLLLLVILFRVTDSVKNVYTSYRKKQEVLFLSHETAKTHSDNKMNKHDSAEIDSLVEHSSKIKNNNITQLLHDENYKKYLNNFFLIKEKVTTDAYMLITHIDKIEKNYRQNRELPEFALEAVSKRIYKIIDQTRLMDQNLKLFHGRDLEAILEDIKYHHNEVKSSSDKSKEPVS